MKYKFHLITPFIYMEAAAYSAYSPAGQLTACDEFCRELKLRAAKQFNWAVKHDRRHAAALAGCFDDLLESDLLRKCEYLVLVGVEHSMHALNDLLMRLVAFSHTQTATGAGLDDSDEEREREGEREGEREEERDEKMPQTTAGQQTVPPKIPLVDRIVVILLGDATGKFAECVRQNIRQVLQHRIVSFPAWKTDTTSQLSSSSTTSSSLQSSSSSLWQPFYDIISTNLEIPVNKKRLRDKFQFFHHHHGHNQAGFSPFAFRKLPASRSEEKILSQAALTAATTATTAGATGIASPPAASFASSSSTTFNNTTSSSTDLSTHGTRRTRQRARTALIDAASTNEDDAHSYLVGKECRYVYESAEHLRATNYSSAALSSSTGSTEGAGVMTDSHSHFNSYYVEDAENVGNAGNARNAGRPPPESQFLASCSQLDEAATWRVKTLSSGILAANDRHHHHHDFPEYFGGVVSGDDEDGGGVASPETGGARKLRSVTHKPRGWKKLWFRKNFRPAKTMENLTDCFSGGDRTASASKKAATKLSPGGERDDASSSKLSRAIGDLSNFTASLIRTTAAVSRPPSSSIASPASSPSSKLHTEMVKKDDIYISKSMIAPMQLEREVDARDARDARDNDDDDHLVVINNIHAELPSSASAARHATCALQTDNGGGAQARAVTMVNAAAPPIQYEQRIFPHASLSPEQSRRADFSADFSAAHCPASNQSESGAQQTLFTDAETTHLRKSDHQTGGFQRIFNDEEDLPTQSFGSTFDWDSIKSWINPSSLFYSAAPSSASPNSDTCRPMLSQSTRLEQFEVARHDKQEETTESSRETDEQLPIYSLRHPHIVLLAFSAATLLSPVWLKLFQLTTDCDWPGFLRNALLPGSLPSLLQTRPSGLGPDPATQSLDYPQLASGAHLHTGEVRHVIYTGNTRVPCKIVWENSPDK